MSDSTLLKAVCLVSSPKLRRVLERSIVAAGFELESRDVLSRDEAAKVDLLFIDQAYRKETTPDELSRMTKKGGSVVILGDSVADDEIANLLKTEGLNHLISEHSAPDEAELLVTTVKLASGDIFGIEKYLTWGAKIHDREISVYEDKSSAINDVVAYAKSMGARRPMMGRLEQVVDELLMNALYDAPAAREGISVREQIEALRGKDGEKVTLRYACDGRYFIVSASDRYGELKKDQIFDHVVRARRERAPKTDGRGGAGLGLHIVMTSVSRFIANIDPGKRTEVVCVFDLLQGGKQLTDVAQSVHVFGADQPAA